MESESERILRARAEDLKRKLELSEEMGRAEHRKMMVRYGVLAPDDAAWEIYKKEKGWSHDSEIGVGSEIRSSEVQTEPKEGYSESGSTGFGNRPRKARKSKVPISSGEGEVA